ncbi:uncharacterized protein LOC126687020 isoform X2 [Mercurialis annua]|uniref:uncharacterized protein LOC126687020 isoform X2 n=1 Tax=Mercurialis annua TaxID=3986 RepID=UPI002160B7ED|nr:uncharacterized protein LOC126687020 isoform X2 [Mercurialis annua]
MINKPIPIPIRISRTFLCRSPRHHGSSEPSLQSNVRKQTSKKSDPPCVVCHGTGRLHCSLCHGLGRRNCLHLRMLPQGEWPKWCTTCGGSGLSYCSRCLGTGEYRYIMGFRFMHNDQQTPSS